MKLNDNVYDFLKWLAIIGLPAFKVAIEPLFNIWGIPYGKEIADTLNIVAVLLGSLLATSTIQYHTVNKALEEVVDENRELG